MHEYVYLNMITKRYDGLGQAKSNYSKHLFEEKINNCLKDKKYIMNFSPNVGFFLSYEND